MASMREEIYDKLHPFFEELVDAVCKNIEETENQKENNNICVDSENLLGVKRKFVGSIKKYQKGYHTGWCFETDTNRYFGHVPDGIEELLDVHVQDGEKYKITIERL